jgi:LL-diaminopimelate aminotransferase
MAFRVAKRLENLPDYPFVAIQAEIRKLVNAGNEVFRMDMGSPDMPPPDFVIEKLAESARQPDKHGYSGYRGTPEFRQAVARYYKKEFDVDLDPESEVLPLLGSKEGLMNLSLAVLSPGDVVLNPTPSYPTYEQGGIMTEAEVFHMPLTKENNFFPDLNAIPEDIAQRARILWLNYPNNPTGAMCSVDDYARAVAFCAKYDILLASDNPYFAVVFDGPFAPSALQAPNAKAHTVEFMSLSKSHNMAGWRMGAAVGNAEVLAALLTVKSNLDSGHFKPAYEAAVCALDETSQEWTDERNAIYANRAKMLVNALPELGLELEFMPKGSLYIWATVPDGDDVAYAHNVLHEAGVAIVAGSTYGDIGRGYVRITLNVPEARLARALDAWRNWASSRP